MSLRSRAKRNPTRMMNYSKSVPLSRAGRKWKKKATALAAKVKRLEEQLYGVAYFKPTKLGTQEIAAVADLRSRLPSINCDEKMLRWHLANGALVLVLHERGQVIAAAPGDNNPLKLVMTHGFVAVPG